MFEKVFKCFFKVLIFWSRCLRNKNKMLYFYYKSDFVVLNFWLNVVFISIVNLVVLVMIKMDLCLVFVKFF